jgi:hypothetical protein
MSVELTVFLRKEELPTRDRWQQAIDSEGLDLKLEMVDTTTHTGFWPVLLNKRECGFEYGFNPVDRGEVTDIQAVLGNRDHSVSFVWHSSMQDGEAAAKAAAVAKITNGVFFDPQSGETAQGADAFQLLSKQEHDERERKMQVAINKWKSATERRCPECGAPCPEYRPTCFVCDFKIGRA